MTHPDIIRALEDLQNIQPPDGALERSLSALSMNPYQPVVCVDGASLESVNAGGRRARSLWPGHPRAPRGGGPDNLGGVA